MKITVEVDEQLLAAARALTGLDSESDLVSAGLNSLVLRQAGGQRLNTVRAPRPPQPAPKRKAVATRPAPKVRQDLA